MARAGYWNHNVHYQSIILGAVPPGCGPALDVGCGDGVLAGRLAERCAQVTGIDRDRRMIALARAQAATTPASGSSRRISWLTTSRRPASISSARTPRSTTWISLRR